MFMGFCDMQCGKSEITFKYCGISEDIELNQTIEK